MTGASARLRRAVPIAALIAGVACSSTGVPAAAELERPRWPVDDPRVELVRTLRSRFDLSGPSLLGWLVGRKDSLLFERPYGVAWVGEDLLVVDAGSSQVLRITPRGRLARSREGLFQGPIGIAACGTSILVTDSRAGRIAVLDGELKLTSWLREGLARPTGIACGAGRAYVAETTAHRILVLDERGATVTSFGRRGEAPGELNFPVSVALAADSLWIGDTLNFRVQRLDPSNGIPLGQLGRLGDTSGDTPRLKGIAQDAAGHLWLTDGQLDRVTLYDPDGVFLMSIGRTGSDPGEFAFPAGVAAHPDGRIAVADSLNRRVQIFRILPKREGSTR